MLRPSVCPHEDPVGVRAADRLGPRLVRAVAEARDVDPMDLRPVYESVDVEALATLFQSDAAEGREDYASFTVAGCDVTVYASGRIDVEPLDVDAGRDANRRTDGGTDSS